MKYGPTFVQSIGDVSVLPRFCCYEGSAPDLQHLRGLVLETATVEELVYVGEREAIVVDMPDGHPYRPWMHVMIVELDANGHPVVDGWKNAEPIPTFGPRAMNTADLALLGFTDAKLGDLAKELLGEIYEPDRPGKSDVRRAMFDRVMAAAYR